MRRVGCAMILAAAGAVTTTVFAPPNPSVAATSRSRLPPAVATYLDAQGKAGFSGVVLVARRGVVLTRAYGMADREFGVRNMPATKFRIGSLTKQFTAAAMLLLVKDRKIALDDALCKYLEDCPDAWRPIRIEQLLDHSSGTPISSACPACAIGSPTRWCSPT